MFGNLSSLYWAKEWFLVGERGVPGYLSFCMSFRINEKTSFSRCYECRYSKSCCGSSKHIYFGIKNQENRDFFLLILNLINLTFQPRNEWRCLNLPKDLSSAEYS
jgi:hypothetical protein